MIKKGLLLIIILYFLILLQTSLFLHLNFLKLVPNAAIILAITVNVLENPKKRFGIYFSLLAGFLLDIFSSHLIGLYMVILLVISLLLKFIFKRYVRIPFVEEI